MRETQVLTHIFGHAASLPAVFPQILVGAGHDCALVATGPRTLLKVDSVIEGVHFAPGTSIDRIAYKAIARAVSDIAAMAGTPRAALAACVLPRTMTAQAAKDLYDAAALHCASFGCPLVGGDTSSHDGPLWLSITVIGDPHPGVVPLRSNAKPGDHLYVTGMLGGSLGSDQMGRHLSFTPRLGEAAFLAGSLGTSLHAMMDLSDGLGIDAGRIATASGISMVMDESRIPIHADAAGINAALGDGEDHELLFTVGPEAVLPAQCPSTGTPFTRIGQVMEGSGVWLRSRRGEVLNISRMGYEHR